tara:strand:- start:605 stop:844 length:240 start_codon:yes stop_codon:yes gene_type:complete
MKHNVTEYLQACGMFKKITEDHNPSIIINLMEGYAQLYHNNLVKNNGVLDHVSNCDCKGVGKDMWGLPKGRCKKCNTVY